MRMLLPVRPAVPCLLLFSRLGGLRAMDERISVSLGGPEPAIVGPGGQGVWGLTSPSASTVAGVTPEEASHFVIQIGAPSPRA